MSYDQKAPRFKDWQTPPNFFAELHEKYDFTIDAAGGPDDPIRALLPRYWDIENDRLAQSWRGERVFCNPRYDASLKRWLAKAAERQAQLAVLLLPPSVDAAWLHDYVLQADSFYFLRGLLRFWRDGKPGPSPRAGYLVAIWRGIRDG
jgi:hypothetical protein